MCYFSRSEKKTSLTIKKTKLCLVYKTLISRAPLPFNVLHYEEAFCSIRQCVDNYKGYASIVFFLKIRIMLPLNSCCCTKMDIISCPHRRHHFWF